VRFGRVLRVWVESTVKATLDDLREVVTMCYNFWLAHTYVN